jgi:hypothetical protein
VKITLTVREGRRRYAVLLPLAGAATVLCADSGVAAVHLTHLPAVTLFAIGLFCGRLVHDSDPRVRH